jgi:UDP-N-acetylglucosamine--N-acetylmuramyl-(pentapeptide) pyrophosphoryl-undecaprenol N-acetylglucosamine transferase
LGLAAARLDIPLVLLEQNVIPGRANQLLSRWAALVCVAFDVTGEHLAAQARTVSTGNPLRGSIERAAAQVARATLTRDARPTLLVLGGSRGAHNINLYMTAALAKVAPALGPWQVIHQTGTRDLDEVRAAYSEASIAADVHAFIEDMAAVYSCASVAICRAGATTLAELAVMGIPAILIPYPLAAANHQWHNAQAFARRGAAVVVEDRPEPGRSVASLVASLLPLVKIDELRSEMRRAMQGSGRLGASALVASEILELVGARGYVRRSA